jgi:hypothetical protein
MLVHLPGADEEKKIFDYLATAHGLSRTDKITREVAQELWKNPEIYFILKEYMNSYERLCAAVKAGSIDEKYAYETLRSRLIYVVRTFETFIEEVRERAGEAVFGGGRRKSIWLEAQTLAQEWEAKEKRRLERRQRLSRLSEKALSKIHKDGVKRKV